MLRAILVSLAVLVAATSAALTIAAAHGPDDISDTPPSVPYSELSLASWELLPGPTGWFAVPIATDAPAFVRVETDSWEYSEGGLQLALPILAIEGGSSWPAFLSGPASFSPVLDASHEGETLAGCCEGIATAWSFGGGSRSIAVFLEPGQRLWIGMAAHEWDDSHSMWFTVSGQANLTQGEPRAGTRVEAVDLFDEARRAGTHVEVVGVHVERAGEATRAWTSEGYGLFGLMAWPWDDEVRASLDIRLPGEALSTHRIEGDAYASVTAHRAGTYEVTLYDVEAPLVHRSGGLDAIALFADIDVPGDAAFIYP